MSHWGETGTPEVFVAAAPGERVIDGDGIEMTATNAYRYNQYGLFRRFIWCNVAIESPPMSARGEWFSVRCHWRDAKRKAAA